MANEEKTLEPIDHHLRTLQQFRQKLPVRLIQRLAERKHLVQKCGHH